MFLGMFFENLDSRIPARRDSEQTRVDFSTIHAAVNSCAPCSGVLPRPRRSVFIADPEENGERGEF
jgi:hypothetical protein